MGPDGGARLMTGFRHLPYLVRRVYTYRQRHKEHQPPDNDINDDAGRPGHDRRRLNSDDMNFRQGAPAGFIAEDAADRPD